MTSHKSNGERQYLIKLVMNRYQWLSVTKDQAAALYDYEQKIESVYARDFIPSVWDEKEIERYFFRQILSDNQFALYLKTTSRQIKNVERQMVAADKELFSQVEYYRNLLSYYKNDLVPKLIAHRKELNIGVRPEVKRRIELLRDEYSDYLRVRFKEVCVSHFRHARGFEPNKFKIETLMHEIEKVVPSYFLFKKAAGGVVRKIGKSLIDMMTFEYGLAMRFIETMTESIKAATEKLDNAFNKEEASRIVVELNAEQSDREQKQDEFLSYLLIDPERYGWQEIA